MFVTNLYAAATEAGASGAAAESPSMLASFFPLILIFALFYFMFIMPQRKQQKKQKAMLSALKPGDKVVTNGGIVGVISKVNEKDDIIQIKSSENTVINVMRAFVSSKVEKPVSTEKAIEEKPDKK